MSTCRGTNRNGKPCGQPARAGEGYCRFHGPRDDDSFFSVLNGTIGSMRAIGIGTSLTIPLYGYLCKQLYLSGYKINYSQFASSGDLTLDAVQAAAFVLPMTGMALGLGWLAYKGRRRIPELLAESANLLQAALRGAEAGGLFVANHLRRLISAGTRAVADKLSPDAKWPAWVMRKPATWRLPPQSPRQEAQPFSEKVIAGVIVACLAVVAAADLIGRYSASRLDRLSASNCSLNAFLCVEPLRWFVHALGEESRDWSLSPEPRSVRFVGGNARLPQPLRVGWSPSEKVSDIELVGKNATYLFLRACRKSPCAGGRDGDDAFVMAANAAQGLSFTKSLADESNAEPPADSRLQVSIGAELIAAATTVAGKLVEAAVEVRHAAENLPRSIKTSGELHLAPKSTVDLALDTKSLESVAQALSSAQREKLQANYRMDYVAREFEDCLDRRRLMRNVWQRVKGQFRKDAVDCKQAIDTHLADIPLPPWLEFSALANDIASDTSNGVRVVDSSSPPAR